MEEPNSDDWLPPGWTVELRVRKNGKRDKYYFSPSSGLKFNSKVEVFRYLDNARNKASIQKISPNVIVEKAIVEGLPPGWVKKTRIATNGDSVRRDTFYIDPVNGYTFCSMEDVDRYLESGEIGRKEFKSKDRLSMISSQSTSVTMKSTLSVSMGQSSDLDMIANDQQIPRSASSKEHMSVPVSECISNQCCTNKDAKEKQLQENSETKHGTEKAQARDRQCKNKHKKEINLPRRASKRLAGIKVDPVPELKTRNRARRAAAKQSGTDGLAKQFNAPAGGLEVKYKSEKHTDMTLEVQRSDKHKEFFSFSHLQNNASVEECVRVLQNGDKSDAKLDYTLDFPLRELLTDPCIAFAIQTLTGVTFEPYKNSQTSAAAGADGEEHGKKSNDANPGNLANPQEHADDDAKTENAGPSSSEKTLDMSLMDPCIDFAIKTLTGTIPLVDSDQNPKKQHSEIALSSVSTLDNIHQTDYCCSQYFGTQTNV